MATTEIVLREAPAAVIDMTADNDRMMERIAAATPQNTQRAYGRQWAAFEAWCAERSLTALPADAHTFALYVSHLATLDQAPSTIGQAMSAIRIHHRDHGHDEQPRNRAALLVLKAHKLDRAERGKRARQAPAVTVTPLHALVGATDPATLAGLRDRVIVVLGFAMGARRSELAALRIEELTFSDNGVTVLIRKSKTDKEAAGVQALIPPQPNPDTDPVRVVRAYLAALEALGVTSGPLLRQVHRSGALLPAGMSGGAVNEVVKRLAAAAALPNAADVTAHGLRAGLTTELAEAGVHPARINETLRWTPRSTQSNGYIRVADGWRDNPLSRVRM
ncbi:tyrosine-type recombinase/integrase [Streptacidiphilus sp. PAMC 29251]